MEEMLHGIRIREKIDVKRHHVPLVSERERVTVPRNFSSQPWYHGLENYYFMYSIHNTVKDETLTQLAEEKSADMMCMFDEFSYLDNLPKYDQYDDDYVVEIYVDSSKKPMAWFCEKE